MSLKAILSYILSLSLLTFPCSAKANTPDTQTSAPDLQQENPISKAPLFSTLTDALNFYEALQTSGEIRNIPRGPSLRLNDTHPHIPLLRHQLQLMGDLAPDSATSEDPERFDSALHAALLRFQKRHGAEVDGILGRQSRRLLNTSPAERVKQIKVNIARQQRFGTPVAPHYIQVNIPEYKLRLYEQGRVTLDMKTIIGRKKRQTPVFDTLINTLVINPSWNVPKSIAFKDIIPKWAEDPDYLAKHNLQIRAGWGPNSAIIPADQAIPASLYQGAEYLRFYEPPHAKNTLGQFKFLSHSNYAIYLHDTPAKQLFNKTQRAFSSGCIRLEKAQDLADALLTLTGRAEQGKLDRLTKTDRTHNIPLRAPIPLYVVYWTAWLDDSGDINFRDDIYHRDMNDLAKFESEENQISTVKQAKIEQNK